MTNNRRLHPEIVEPLLPAPSDGRVVLRVQGRSHVEGVEGGGRVRLAFDRFLGPEHGENNVVSHHIKVPGDDRALVLVLDQHFVRLEGIQLVSSEF